MTDVALRARFLASGTWIGLDAVGMAFELERDGKHVRVALPSEPDAFSEHLVDDSPYPVFPSLASAGPVFAEPGGDTRTAALVIFEVVVDFECDFPVPKPDDLTPEVRALADAGYAEGASIAITVAGDFLRHLHAAAPAQSWRGLAAHDPEQYGVAQLEYRPSGQRIIGYGPAQTQTMRSSRLRVDLNQMLVIAANVADGRSPDLPSSLLADAWHFTDSILDLDRATLIAAIACEVRVKQTIRDLVPADRLAMTELVLRRRSNLPELLDEVIAAALSVTLRLDDPPLFKRVQVLAAQRNMIVHAGRSNPDTERVRTPAQTGADLFAWLDGLPDRL